LLASFVLVRIIPIFNGVRGLSGCLVLDGKDEREIPFVPSLVLGFALVYALGNVR